MTVKKAIQMIDEYLLEPNSIHKEWVEILLMCRKALADADFKEAEINELWAENDILRAERKTVYNGIVQAKKKGWHRWLNGEQPVSGYLLIIGDRYFIYNKAKINPYGTIAIDEYVEVDPNTIGVKADGTV